MADIGETHSFFCARSLSVALAAWPVQKSVVPAVAFFAGVTGGAL